MAINSVVQSDSITVFGPPEVIEIGLDVGSQGERGSYIYTGFGDPNIITSTFTNNPQKIGDLYYRVSNNVIYQYTLKPGGNQWEQVADLGINLSINSQSETYTIGLSDVSRIIEMNSASANILTIPADSTTNFSIGAVIDIVQFGVGQTSIAAAAGVTILSKQSYLKLDGQYARASIYKKSSNLWVLTGQLSA